MHEAFRGCLRTGQEKPEPLGYATLCKKHISKKEHPHRDLSTALRPGRDDKGECGASREGGC
jgi:hypothetical protein